MNQGCSSTTLLFTCGASVATGILAGFLLARLRNKDTSDKSKSHFAEPLPVNLELVKAIHFSTQKHKNQRRKHAQKTPYICHPVSVAHRLAVDGGIDDQNVLIAALLHDTVEDTDTTLDEIEATFGLPVAKIVDEVSDDKSLPKQMRKQLQIEHAPHASPQAKLVKLADKLDNLSDLILDAPVGWTAERVAEYFAWAEQVIAGLRGTNSALESQLDDVLADRRKAVEAVQRAAHVS